MAKKQDNVFDCMQFYLQSLMVQLEAKIIKVNCYTLDWVKDKQVHKGSRKNGLFVVARPLGGGGGKGLATKKNIQSLRVYS